MSRANKSSKVRKNFLLPEDLAKWIDSYARENHTTMTQIIVDYLTHLRRQSEASNVEQI